MCCSLSVSEDNGEELAKEGKGNAGGGQDGVADEEGLVDFSKHLYWCTIRGNSTLRDFTGISQEKWEVGEQKGKRER